MSAGRASWGPTITCSSPSPLPSCLAPSEPSSIAAAHHSYSTRAAHLERLQRQALGWNAEALIAAELGALQPALPYVPHHHERCDGAAYPGGLAGEAIPCDGRLLAIVDAYHAMPTRRPYHPQMSRESALDEIRGGAGRQFDPDMAAAFYELRLSPRRNFYSA